MMKCVAISLALMITVHGALFGQSAAKQSDGVRLPADTTKLSLLFIGDVMQHDTQIAAALDPTTGKYDYRECFADVKPVLESADLTIANLEVTLGGTPYKGYPNFSAPDELVETLTWSGVDILVTANNHCLDRGKKGLQRTIAQLDTMHVPHTGTFVDSAHRAKTYPMLIEKNGFRFSLLNYTYGTNGIVVTKPNVVNYIDTTQIDLDIKKANEQSPDFVVIVFHWGDEYQRLPNKSQKSLTEFCFKRGVKLVIGAHPHVLQPMEWRKEQDQLVVYSLGNFVSGQSSRFKNGGGMIRIELQKVNTDSVSNVKIAAADYQLQYIYRDAKKKYHVLPVLQFENDTTVMKEKLARASMKEFATDSRKLFAQHNINIEEHKSTPDSIFYIQVNEFDSAWQVGQMLDVDSVRAVYKVLEFYGVRRDSVDGKVTVQLGTFFEREIAMKAMTDLKQRLPRMKAIVRRRKG